MKPGSVAMESVLSVQHRASGCLAAGRTVVGSPWGLLVTLSTLNRSPLGLQDRTLHADCTGRHNGFGKPFPYILEMIQFNQVLCKLHSAIQM